MIDKHTSLFNWNNTNSKWCKLTTFGKLSGTAFIFSTNFNGKDDPPTQEIIKSQFHLTGYL